MFEIISRPRAQNAINPPLTRPLEAFKKEIKLQSLIEKVRLLYIKLNRYSANGLYDRVLKRDIYRHLLDIGHTIPGIKFQDPFRPEGLTLRQPLDEHLSRYVDQRIQLLALVELCCEELKLIRSYRLFTGYFNTSRITLHIEHILCVINTYAHSSMDKSTYNFIPIAIAF